MEAFYAVKGWQTLLDNKPDRTVKELERDSKAKGTLSNFVSDSYLPIIEGAVSTHAAWLRLMENTAGE